MPDLVIRNGLLVDGTGAPPRHADVAIAGRLVVEVGDDVGGGGREIDAAGLAILPGWVDIHTHYDGQVSWDPIGEPSSVHGVTSVAMGNCGVGFAPSDPDRHEWLISLLEGVEDIPGSALSEGLPWDWETFPEFLDAVDRRPHTFDIGAHVPHSALRVYVMGERGADHTEPATEADIEKMRDILGESLRAGALGFSTSRTKIHRTGRGEFVPTMTASAAELIGIASEMTAQGRGVMQLVSDLYLSESPDQVEREEELLGELARRLRRPLSFTVEQVDAVPNRWREMMALVDDLVAEGLDVKAQVANRPIGLILGAGCSVHPFALCPSYRSVAHLPLGERIAALNIPDRKARILAEHASLRLHGFPEMVAKAFDRQFPLSERPDYEPDADRSLSSLAGRAGRKAADYAYDHYFGNGRDLVYLPLNNYASGNLDDVREMMTSPNAVFGLSDGGAHCNFICDASFPTTSLSLWARDRTRGPRLPLEFLVHQQTARPARHVGWMDRGVLAPGFLADLNLVDLDRVGERSPRVVTDLPAGGTRLLQAAEGYHLTMKSGVVTFEDGVPTGDLPGSVVRGARPDPRTGR